MLVHTAQATGGSFAAAAAATGVEQAAVNWAASEYRTDPSAYGYLCLAFVDQAYLEGGFSLRAHVSGMVWNSDTYPDDVWPHIASGTTGAPGTTPPVGALIFFNAGPGGDGGAEPSHVEIYVGGGEDISTEDYAGSSIHYEAYGAHPRELGWWLPDGTGTGSGGGTGPGGGGGTGYQPPDSPDGYQHLFGLGDNGEPTELYFQPDVANTMGEGPLMSTPGAVDVASTVDSAGDIIVYTLGSDGSVYQVYYKPGVAGTMGEGYIGTLPGAVRISAVTGPDGYQHILGVTSSGLVEELYYEPSVANTVGEGPLMSTPGTVDIASATDAEGYINVYTLGSDGSVYSLYYRPAVAGTMGEGPLEPIPGATELSAVG